MIGEKFARATGMTLGAAMVALLAVNWGEVGPGIAKTIEDVWAAFSRLPWQGFGFVASVVGGVSSWHYMYRHPVFYRAKPHDGADNWALGVGWCMCIALQLIFGSGYRGFAAAVVFGYVAGTMSVLIARKLWSWSAPPKEDPQP